MPLLSGRVRNDRRCGQQFPLDDGTASECDPNSANYCCSKWGYCGPGADHCDCPECTDYRTSEQKGKESQSSPNYQSSHAMLTFTQLLPISTACFATIEGVGPSSPSPTVRVLLNVTRSLAGGSVAQSGVSAEETPNIVIVLSA